MKPWEILGQARTPDRATMTLTRSGDEYVIRVDGQQLMSSRMHGSEDALAAIVCDRIQRRPRPRALVGGLGMGFTLRATLDLLPADAAVLVVELLPAVVVWNRSELGNLAGYPLEDPRVEVEVGDVAATLHRSVARFDAILLDVDNGPSAFTSTANEALYDGQGLAAARRALETGGVLAVWSAKDDRRFQQRMREAGFSVEARHVRAHRGKGSRHVIFVGQTPDASQRAGRNEDVW
jgi:spermidine synthase